MRYCSYLHNFFLRSVIFPYNSLYTQAVAYITYFELGQPVVKTNLLPYRVVIAASYVHYFHIIYDVSEAIFCLFYKHCHVAWKNLAVKSKLVGSDEVLPICVVSKLAVFRSAK